MSRVVFVFTKGLVLVWVFARGLLLERLLIAGDTAVLGLGLGVRELSILFVD